MAAPVSNERKNRDRLIVERNQLFSRFLQHPLEIGLALEIKVIDDQIADCSKRIRAEDKRTELREKKNTQPH